MKISDRALELIIRDVMGGMEELATIEGYSRPPECLEILAIEPPGTVPDNPAREKAVVLPFPDLKKTA